VAIGVHSSCWPLSVTYVVAFACVTYYIQLATILSRDQLYTGSGLVIGLIGLFQHETCDYTLQITITQTKHNRSGMVAVLGPF
jgi:hypothetical protein